MRNAAEIVDDVLLRAHTAMAAALNAEAEAVYERSQQRVPKSGKHKPDRPNYPAQTLEESGAVKRAVPSSLYPRAEVIYDSPYAAAQEVGEMVEQRKGGPVAWKASNYTTPGTGAHYLEDSVKEVLGGMSENLALQARLAFDNRLRVIPVPGAHLGGMP